MTDNLNGKAALVTGAASGIGRAVAEALAAEGCRVALADRADCSATADAIESAGGDAFGITMDVTDEGGVTEATANAVRRLGGLNIAVLSAGIADDGPLLETSLTDWNRVIAVNLSGIFLTGRETIRAMLGNSDGRVIVIASDHAFMGWEERSAYCASKAGVLGLVRTWAREFGPAIRVNAICPGPVETPLLTDGLTPELLARETDIPLGRIGQPNEIAAAVVALTGKAGAFTTGQAWGVNGGSVMT